MICRLKNKGIHILFMVIFVHITGRLAFAFEQDKIIQARQLFYLSVEHRDTIDKAIQLFKEIGENKTYEGVALTYTGALTALKGKFAFLPITKYRRVLKGLHMMDQGIEISPDNLEARFIRGMTCYYLPFFFKRKKTARNDFKVIINQLKTVYHRYDVGLIIHVTDFLLEHAELNREETEIIKEIQNHISKNEG